MGSSFARAGLLAAFIVIAGLLSWELLLRSKGIGVTYDDGAELWSDKRRKASLPADQATVFIGSSRHKFDIDIRTWTDLTGEKAIQLAEVGSSPLPVLEDLSSDPDFRGKLLIDVTEPLFFSLSPRSLSVQADYVKHYHDRTPAQRASFAINELLESRFSFLDKDYLSLNGLMQAHLQLPNRPGVFTLPYECPMDFTRVTFDRETIMSKRFEQDTLLQYKVKTLWKFYASGPEKPLAGPPLDSLINLIRGYVARITARGGQVIFVRSPSSGPMWQGEQMGFPRDKYWQRLLTATGVPGLHFADYPELANFQCPEFSHLKKADAVIYTTELVSILQKNYGWKFPHHPSGFTTFNHP